MLSLRGRQRVRARALLHRGGGQRRGVRCRPALAAAASEGKRLVVAYECEGTGGDVCDLQRTGYDVPRLGATPPAADAFDGVADAVDGVADAVLVEDSAVSAAAATAASLALASVVALSALA